MSSATPRGKQAPRTPISSSRCRGPENGPTIGYHLTGAEDGPLVVALDGSGSGGLGRAMGPVSVQLGIRLLLPDPPRLGSSTPPRRRAFAAVAEDLVALVDGAGFRRFGIVAQPGSIPYALALAATASDRVTGIAFVAALAPLHECGAIPNLSGPMRPVFRVAQQAPWLLGPMFNAYARQVRRDPEPTASRVAPELLDTAPVAPQDVANCAAWVPITAEIVTSPAALARETRMLAGQSGRRGVITAPVALWAAEIDEPTAAPSSDSDKRRPAPVFALAAVYPEVLRHAAGLP